MHQRLPQTSKHMLWSLACTCLQSSAAAQLVFLWSHHDFSWRLNYVETHNIELRAS